MKTTTFLTALLLAFQAHAQISNLSPDEFEEIIEWNESTFPTIPSCVERCSATTANEDEAGTFMPPCAMTDQDADEDQAGYDNAMKCLCADRIWQAASLECVLKTCKGKDAQDAIDYTLSTLYVSCAVYSDQRWPEPKTVLAELCLDDDFPKDAIIPDVKEIFKDAPKLLSEYEYADSWPEQTATTFAPQGTPVPDTREPLECQAGSGDDKGEEADAEETVSETSGTKTGSAPKETGTQAAETDATEEEKEDDKGVAAGGAKVGAMMMAIVGLVGGLAVVL